MLFGVHGRTPKVNMFPHNIVDSIVWRYVRLCFSYNQLIKNYAGHNPLVPVRHRRGDVSGLFTNVSKSHLLLGCLLAVHLAMRIKDAGQPLRG